MTTDYLPVIMNINDEFGLQQFDKLNQALFHHHPDAIYILDLDGNFVMVNEEVCRVSGYAREELIGQNFDPLIEDSLKAFTQEMFRLTKQDQPQRYETAINTRKGTKYLDVTNFPIKSDDQIVAIFGIAKDITDKKQKEFELEKYTATLKVHNDELEVFRKILAHDMRKPVANALGFARLLQANLAEAKEKDIKRYLLQTVESLDTMVRDLNELIDLQSTGDEVKEEIEVKEAVEKIVAFFQTDISKSGATITLHIDQDLKITTIKAYFNSILRNLISNALKYHLKEQKPHINISASKHDKGWAFIIRDNGIGMDLPTIGKELFKMHRRFAPTIAEGNGIGLFIVKQQLALMGGEIHVNSEPGKGSEFTIILPS